MVDPGNKGSKAEQKHKEKIVPKHTAGWMMCGGKKGKILGLHVIFVYFLLCLQLIRIMPRNWVFESRPSSSKKI
jgi:hypothetical protein